MEDLDQSPLVSSSSDQPPRPQPQFKYQFVTEPEDEEEEEEEEDEEDEDLEELEVLERKPAAGLSAAPLPAASAPLLDLDSDSVPPAPRGPLPAPPAAVPERPSPWDDSPASAGLAPSAPAAAAATTATTLPSARPEEDAAPAGVSPSAEPAWTPAPAAPPSTPAAPKRRGSSGSADETLFALPAASEPVIHASAEKIMDLKEQPGSTVSAGQEDSPSVLLETTASLPSLSPLSAAPFKEHEYLGNLSAVSPTKGTLEETSNEASREFLEKAKHPFVDGDFTEFSELEYSQMGRSFSASSRSETTPPVPSPRGEAAVPRKDAEDLGSNRVLHNPQELPVAFTKPVNEDRLTSLESTEDAEKAVPVLKETPMREEYADFKPFERVWEGKDTSKELYKPEGVLAASAAESQAYKKYFADSLEQTSHEKDSESSNDGGSFPSTPEAVKDGSEAYITCAPFNPAAAASMAANTFPALEDHTLENKTDEKKIEEKKAQIVTEKSTGMKASNPFHVATPHAEADYVTTDGLSKVAEGGVASMPEGLTPDLVQEACESELSEATGTKVAYETRMDLVQTSEGLQEALYPGTQLCPSFEESEATPSPVLPDIVMEAPLSSGLPGAATPAPQPASSPLEAPRSGSYETLKPAAENPPPYEEAASIPGKKEEPKEPGGPQAAVQDTETPYISIACDLIKGTKLSAEPTPDFSSYSEIARVAQPAPDRAELVEDSSPDSEPVDLFSDDSIPDVPEKQEEAVLLGRENFAEAAFEPVTKRDSKETFSVLPSEAAKPYLESFQPTLDAAKDSGSPGDVSPGTKKEQTPLQVEELPATVYSNDGFFISKEEQVRESETFSDSSPIEIIDEFPTLVSSKTDFSPQFAREYTDLERSHKSEVAKIQDEAGWLPGPELPRDLSLKNIQPRGEEKIPASEELCQDPTAKGQVPSLSPGLASRAEEGIAVTPRAVGKEAERKRPSEAERENRPTAIFSAELSKTSVVDLLYWRDIKKTGVVFGASLFLLLSLTVFSIVSVTAYIALALLSVTISFRVYKGVIQAVQKSDEGHPFRAYLDSDVAISEELAQKYSHSALGHVNCTIKELRRLFLVDDLVDSLKFAVLMWVFTYVGALFNGLTLLILALIALFSVPVIYERHQAQIDHYVGLANKNVKDAMAKIQAKIPGLKRKAE
ncbi:reticulon-4 isoform 1-T1 [Rhynchocyon petersi]